MSSQSALRKAFAVPYKTPPGAKHRIRLLKEENTPKDNEAQTILTQLSQASSATTSLWCLSESIGDKDFPDHSDPDDRGVEPSLDPQKETNLNRTTSEAGPPRCSRGNSKAEGRENSEAGGSGSEKPCKKRILNKGRGHTPDESHSPVDPDVSSLCGTSEMESVYNFELSPESQRKRAAQISPAYTKHITEIKLLKLIERTRREIQMWRERYEKLIQIRKADK